MKPTDPQLADLARMVVATADGEIDCAEMLNRVAAYLKTVAKRGVLDEGLRQVAQHLRICPECREEFATLLKAEGLDPAVVLRESS